MITEDYVSFETAKILKEKGFNSGVCKNSPHYYYNTDGEFSGPSWDSEYPAPTLQMAMKWLREAYNLHISVSVGTDESSDADGKIVEEWSFWTYLIESTYGNVIYDAYAQFDPTEYQSYEEVCEAAIKYCLENLI